MKLFLAICLATCIIGVYCEDNPKLAERVNTLTDAQVKKCADDNKVEQKAIDDLLHKNEVPNTPEMQCFLACIMKTAGVMDDNGIPTQKFMDKRPAEECTVTRGKDACETAYKIVKCLIKHDRRDSHEKEDLE